MASQCSPSPFPFTFYDAAGQTINGTLDDNGICYFPGSNCGMNAITGKGPHNCCVATGAPGTIETGGNYMYIALALILIPVWFIHRWTDAVQEKHPALKETIGRDRTPSWIKNGPLKFLAGPWDYGIYAGIVAMVVVPTQMKPSVQYHFNVGSRNVLQGAEAFLIPYKEIFQFIEDIVNIKIQYALNAGDRAAVNSLLHLGIAGSLITGVFASGLASILGAIPSVLMALTNPGLATDMELYPGCDIVAAEQDTYELKSTYWFIESWKFVGTQVAMVLVGFLYGAVEFATVGWIMAAGFGVIPLVWFTSVSRPIQPLILLAWAEFASPYVMLILAIFYLATPLGSTIRENTGVKLSITKLCQSFGSLFRLGGARGEEEPSDSLHTSLLEEAGLEGNEEETADEAPDASTARGLHTSLSREADLEGNKEDTSDESHDSSVADLLKDGFKIMILDLAVQLSKSLANYLALSTDAATAYQLTALDSYLPSYGIAWTMGMAITFKVFGSFFLSIKEFGYFFKLVVVYIICAFCLIPLLLGTTLPPKFNEALALTSGQNACEYAYSLQCVPFFTNVFGANVQGGQFTIFNTYSVFAFGVAAESIFLVVRAIIITMLDFDYIVKSTGVAMLFYIAAIAIACVVKPFAKQAISFWIAMYVPHTILVLLFLGRLHCHYKRMAKGEVSGAIKNRLVKLSPEAAQYI
ncbi:hypothetical protein ACHAWF_002479 [Thalassiosira exigua]